MDTDGVWESQGDKTIHGNLNGVKPSFPLDPMRLVSAVLNLRVWNPAPYFSWSCTTHLPPSPSLFKFVVLLACDHPPTTHRWPQFPCVGILQSGLILHSSSCESRPPRQWLWPRVSGTQSFWPPWPSNPRPWCSQIRNAAHVISRQSTYEVCVHCADHDSEPTVLLVRGPPSGKLTNP